MARCAPPKPKANFIVIDHIYSTVTVEAVLWCLTVAVAVEVPGPKSEYVSWVYTTGIRIGILGYSYVRTLFCIYMNKFYSVSVASFINQFQLIFFF